MTQDHRTATHTQGPWSFDGQRVKDPNGKTVADMRYMSGRVNGPVVAAAPDMLDALLYADAEFERLGLPEDCSPRLGVCAAIAKAEGRK